MEQENDLERLGLSANQCVVYCDMDSSHAATHFEDTPALKGYVKTAISYVSLHGELVLTSIDMGSVIGMTDLVTIEPGDEIVYAKRKNRDEYAIFNRSGTPRPCSTVALILETRSPTSYVLLSAWIGLISPPFPGDPNETPESGEFWSTHALAWGTQEIQPGTETKERPW